MAGALVVCLLAGGFLPVLPTGAKETRPGVTIGLVRVRDAAADTGHALLKLPDGVELTITGAPEDGFFPVEYGPVRGWAPTGSLESPAIGVSDDAAARKERRKSHVVVAGANLNVRADANDTAAVLGAVRKGAPLTLSGETRNGYLGVLLDGKPGWVLGKHLTAPRAGEDDGVYSRAEIIAIIYEAADKYGQSRADMQRVARCESDLEPDAVNKAGGSYGLFQFKPYTWADTPYGDYDIFDPRANAMAAAWMWSEGRKSAWVCQ